MVEISTKSCVYYLPPEEIYNLSQKLRPFLSKIAYLGNYHANIAQLGNFSFGQYCLIGQLQHSCLIRIAQVGNKCQQLPKWAISYRLQTEENTVHGG